MSRLDYQQRFRSILQGLEHGFELLQCIIRVDISRRHGGHFFRGILHVPAGALIDLDKLERFLINNIYFVERLIHNPTEAKGQTFRQFLLGDVLHGSDHFDGFTLLIECHHRFFPDKAYRTIRPDHSVNDIVLFLTGYGFRERFLDHRHVIGMNIIYKPFISDLELLGLETKNAENLIRPINLIGFNAPDPTAGMGHRLRLHQFRPHPALGLPRRIKARQQVFRRLDNLIDFRNHPSFDFRQPGRRVSIDLFKRLVEPG